MEYTKQIERYVEGRMGKEELESFRKELSSDPRLASLVAHAVKIQQAGYRLFAGDPYDLTSEVEESAGKDVASFRQAHDPQLAEEIRQFREQLEQAEKDHYEQNLPETRIFLGRKFWYYAAALVILAVAISLLLNRYGKPLSCPALYREYFLAYAGSANLFDQTRSDNDFLHAVTVYEAGQYKEALDLFEPFINSNEYGAYALFYSGLSGMGLKQFTEAISYLQRSLDKANRDLAGPVHWYLGLSYLAVNDAGAAVEQLKAAGMYSAYSEKAGKIIKKIRKLPGFSDS